MKTLAIVALVGVPACASAEPLDLICHGVAQSTEATRTYGSVNADGRFATGSATTYRPAQSEEDVRIHVDDGGSTGKLRLPRPLVPSISVGKDGWWDFVKLTVDEDFIHGQISLNMFNKPRIAIDRHTGEIELTELGGSFSGSCEKAPEASEERKF